MPISFNVALTNALAPHHYIEFNNSNAYDGLSSQKQILLLVEVLEKAVELPDAPSISSTEEAQSSKRVANSARAVGAPPLLNAEKKEEPKKPPTHTELAQLAVKNAAPSITSEKKMLLKQDSAENYAPAIRAILSEIPYTQIVLFSKDNSLINEEILLAWKSLLKERWNHELQLDGHLFVAKHGEIEELKDLAKVLNSPHITIIPLKDRLDAPEKWAPAFAAVNAVYATTPSRPYQNLIVSGLKTAETNNGYTLKERNALLAAGISTWRKNGSDIIIDRLVTTYTTTETGAIDPSYRDLNTLQTLSFLRYDFRTAVALRYPRHMLAKDDYPYKGPVITPKIARMFVISRYRQWQENNLVQDPGGLFAKNLNVEASDTPGKLDFHLPIHVMGQWRITQTSIAFKI